MEKEDIELLINKEEADMILELLDNQLEKLHQLLKPLEDGTVASDFIEKNIEKTSNLLLKIAFYQAQLEQ